MNFISQEKIPLPAALVTSLKDEFAVLRGYWEDAHTFHFEEFDIGVLTRRIVFDGDGLQIHLPEAELTIPCRIQDQS